MKHRLNPNGLSAAFCGKQIFFIFSISCNYRVRFENSERAFGNTDNHKNGNGNLTDFLFFKQEEHESAQNHDKKRHERVKNALISKNAVIFKRKGLGNISVFVTEKIDIRQRRDKKHEQKQTQKEAHLFSEHFVNG